jgi:hypothetical protein
MMPRSFSFYQSGYTVIFVSEVDPALNTFLVSDRSVHYQNLQLMLQSAVRSHVQHESQLFDSKIVQP